MYYHKTKGNFKYDTNCSFQTWCYFLFRGFFQGLYDPQKTRLVLLLFFFTAVLLDEENEETADHSRLSQTIETANLVSSMGMSSNFRSKQFKGNSSVKWFTRSQNCRPHHLDEVFICELYILNRWLISDLKLFFILFKGFFEVFIILKRPD